MNRESFFHAFFQAPRGAGIDPIQLLMKLLQRAPGICVFHHAVGGCQLALDARLILVRQLLQHVSAFVGLTALHQRSLARVTLHCRVQRFGASRT